MTRKSALVGVGVVSVAALAGAIALARCAGQEQRPVETASTEPATAVSEAAPDGAADTAPRTAGKAIAPLAADAGAPEGDSEAAPSTASASASVFSDTPPTSSAGSSISRAVAASHPPDLALLGRIERELHRDPPPEVHAMLRRRAEGASRDELVGMARALPDLQLRVLVLRWVDEVRPGANPGARTPTVPAPGSAAPLVKPIEPKR